MAVRIYSACRHAYRILLHFGLKLASIHRQCDKEILFLHPSDADFDEESNVCRRLRWLTSIEKMHGYERLRTTFKTPMNQAPEDQEPMLSTCLMHSHNSIQRSFALDQSLYLVSSSWKSVAEYFSPFSESTIGFARTKSIHSCLRNHSAPGPPLLIPCSFLRSLLAFLSAGDEGYGVRQAGR